MQSTLSGVHKDSVLSLACKGSLLASGGEDNLVALWDLREPSRPASTLVMADEVPSLSFYGNDQLLAASGAAVLGYDLRQPERPVLEISNLDDTVNSISLSAKESLLAVATDADTVQVFELPSQSPYKRLHGHTSVVFVTRFHPDKPWDLASGGYDGKVFIWDVSRGKPKAIQDFMQSGTYIVNPPFVLSADWKRHTLALGLNNGNVAFFHTKGKAPCFKRVSESLHNLGVSQVVLLEGEERLLTAGNDSKLALWRLTDDAVQPLRHILHGRKIHALTRLDTARVAVADVGPDIVLYDFQ